MLKIRQRAIHKTGFLLVFSIALFGCGGGSSSNRNNPAPLPIPSVPEYVQVVSGDSDRGEVQNTISWTLVPDATEYTVYWDDLPGVTESSRVVMPSAEGTRYVIHSGAEVVAGTVYYYRVKAISAGGESALSAEVSGTPQQSITGNQLNDVAWNGLDSLIAVGDSGVILNSTDGRLNAWNDVSTPAAPQALTGITWENVNAQFLIVGAGSTVLTGDGNTWTRQDLSNLPGAVNLEDIAWLGDRYIAVGKSGTILTGNADGSAWTLQDAGASAANVSLNAVASNGNRIVVVGTNGTILNSVDDITWDEVPLSLNQDLNDVSWDGNQFLVCGSNDTILTSPDGLSWTSHVPGTSDINFVAATQWDSGRPLSPVMATVGSAGTFVVNPDGDPGDIIRTGTTEQLGGITWVDNQVDPAYFVIVGNDGTVLTNQYQ